MRLPDANARGSTRLEFSTDIIVIPPASHSTTLLIYGARQVRYPY